jgi:hypothetical protein
MAIVRVLGFMRSGLDLQAFDDTPMDQVFLDDFLDIVGVNVLIPHRLWIDDENGAVVASIQTPRLVDANFPFPLELQFGNPVFRVSLRVACAKVITATFTIFPLVAAKKDMVFEIAHDPILR